MKAIGGQEFVNNKFKEIRFEGDSYFSVNGTIPVLGI